MANATPQPIPGLSAVIITKNEVEDIEGCLRSIQGVVSEIIVFDSGSTDGTVELCRKLGAKVFVTDWPGFGPQKNRAIDAASGQWILSLDADERVSPKLSQEIFALLQDNPRHSAFRIPRKSSFCGRFMRHSGWCPDYVIRLFLKEQGRFEGMVHEKIIHAGTLGTLNHTITHLSIKDIEEALEKLNTYSSAGAQILLKKERKSSILEAFLRGFWMFFRTYFIKLGFLDGREGFVLAIINAENSFYKYAKLTLDSHRKNT